MKKVSEEVEDRIYQLHYKEGVKFYIIAKRMNLNQNSIKAIAERARKRIEGWQSKAG